MVREISDIGERMRRKFKNKIALMLSAGMLFSVPAPAMPVMAATPSTTQPPTAGQIQFNFTEKNDSVDRFAPDLTLSAAGNSKNPGDLMSPVPGDLQSGASGISLPYMKDSGTFDPALTFKADGETPGKTWAQRGLTGYKIVNWYPKKENGIASPFMYQNPAIYPHGGLTYYAELGPDTGKSYYYKVNHKKASTANYFIPGLDDPGPTPAFKNVPDRNVNVMSGISTAPLTIPGFTITNQSTTSDGDGGSTVVMEDNFAVNKTHIEFDTASKYVTGTSINKGVEITYKYVVDPSQTNSITVQDSVFKSSAAVALYDAGLPTGTVLTDANSPLYTVPRTVSEVAALTAGQKIGDINNIPVTVHGNATTVGLQGKPDLILERKVVNGGNTTYTPARYILDSAHPITVTYGNGKPNSDGYFTTGSPATVIRNLIPAKDDAANNLQKITTVQSMMGDTGHEVDARKVVGTMLNQPVTVTFNYIPNPAYFVNLKVKYEDDQGNNITQTVLDTLAAAGTPIADPPATEVTGTFYKEPNGTDPVQFIYAKANTQATAYSMTIEAPRLTSYRDQPALGVDNPGSWTGSYTPSLANLYTGWTAANPRYTVSTSGPTDNMVLTVTYTQDPDAIVQLTATSLEGGDLYVTRGGSTITYDNYLTTGGTFPRLLRKNVQAAAPHKYDVDIKLTDLPTPVPNAGYLFDKWTYLGQTVNFDSNGVATLTNITPTAANTISLIANFKKDQNAWYSFNLAEGDSHVQLLNGNVAEVPRKDALGVDRINVPWSEIQDFTEVSHNGINVEAGYTPKWFNAAGREIDTTTVDLSTLAGQTLYVYGQSTTPVTSYTPNVTGSIHPTTGAPTLSIDPSAPAQMDTRLAYVVTDATGNVVAILSGADVMRDGGQVTNPAIQPGNTYQISTVPTTDAGSIVVGSPIPASVTSASAPSAPETIPVALTPTVSQDTVNIGQAVITINPTSPNTDYALVDSTGNEVYPFTAASTPGAAITFDNLNPNTVYRVIPRMKGSTATTQDRIGEGAALPVDTSNIGLAVNRFDITAIAQNAPAISRFKIGGRASTDPSVLLGIAKDTEVEIEAPGLDNNSQIFSHWNIVSGSPLPNVNATTNLRLTFTMPNRPVKLQAMYSTGTDWDDNVYNDNVSSGKQVGVVNPVIAEQGNFRVVINKDSVPANIKTMIADTFTDPYTDVFKLNVVVQKKNLLTNAWEDYVPATGDIDLETTIETGVLLSTRDYKLHELASSSNAVRELSGDFENPSTSYPGQFDITLQSGKTYVFGYILPSMYRVKIRDSRDNDLITDFHIKSTEAVQDKSGLYSGRIVSDYIDNDGLTWHYEGLSTDRNNYVDFDPSSKVTEDMTLYLFYLNDRSKRSTAENNLKSAVSSATADLRSYNPPSQRLLKSKLAQVQAVLNRINRKSSTAELEAALADLNALLATLTRNNSGGGGGGGSSSGGGSARRGTGTAGNPFKVGYDGNWELTNPEEAQSNLPSSKWVFNITNGGQVIGWAYLSYTYEGYTKSEWYHFGTNNIMDSGWFFDGANGKWYFLSKEHNGFFGEMKTGWIMDGGRWYYLNPANGEMVTGWIQIDGSFYYFNTAAGQAGKPYGAMYSNERTPDGYNVNSNGVWN